MSEEDLAREWAEVLKGGSLRELRRLAARHESVKESTKPEETEEFDTRPKPDIIKED